MESVLDVELKPLVKGFLTHENAVYAVAVKIFYKAHRNVAASAKVHSGRAWRQDELGTICHWFRCQCLRESDLRGGDEPAESFGSHYADE